jgi:hypothetical protein
MELQRAGASENADDAGSTENESGPGVADELYRFLHGGMVAV